MVNDSAKTHAPMPDERGQLFSFPNPNGTRSLLRVTICGHIYEAGIVSDILDEVTCKSCQKQLRKANNLALSR